MSPHLKTLRLLVSAALLGTAALAGCSPLNLHDNFSFWSAESQPQMPTRIVAFWTDEVLTQPGKTPVRGFAGRVMFYNDTDKDQKPVRVDGTFTVFAFDDADRDSGYSAPEKRFVYRPEQLEKYYSESELGHSYSLWLPWDEVGGPERKLCLIARFESGPGTAVVASPCRKVLPGTPPAPGQPGSRMMSLTKSTSPPPVQQASYDAPPAPPRPPEPKAAAITIDVSPDFARRSLLSPGLPSERDREAPAEPRADGGSSGASPSRPNIP